MLFSLPEGKERYRELRGQEVASFYVDWSLRVIGVVVLKLEGG